MTQCEMVPSLLPEHTQTYFSFLYMHQIHTKGFHSLQPLPATFERPNTSEILLHMSTVRQMCQAEALAFWINVLHSYSYGTSFNDVTSSQYNLVTLRLTPPTTPVVTKPFPQFMNQFPVSRFCTLMKLLIDLDN